MSTGVRYIVFGLDILLLYTAAFFSIAYLSTMQKIEHIGIAVKDLDEAEKRYTGILGVPPYKRELVASQNVMTSFFMTGPNKIELLASTTEDGVIAKFVERKGEGMHHIAFAVDDIYEEMERLQKEGYRLLNDEPKPGADKKIICFLHPKDANGTLIELCQERKSDDH